MTPQIILALKKTRPLGQVNLFFCSSAQRSGMEENMKVSAPI